MNHAIPELDASGLRRFGITTGLIVAGLFGLALPWVFELGYPVWPWILCGVLAVWGLVAPSSLNPVYRTWMKFGLLLSKITTPLVLGLVFYLMFTPISAFMSLIKRDSMSRNLEKEAPTYRVQSRKRSTESMEKPY